MRPSRLCEEGEAKLHWTEKQLRKMNDNYIAAVVKAIKDGLESPAAVSATVITNARRGYRKCLN
jgi:hypothetical protein